MPDYRRIMDPGPNDPITPELLRQWNPGGPQGGMGLDPSYSDRYLLDEGSKDTLGNLIQTLQGASNRTENIDAGLGRLQGLQEEQKSNLQPLWDQENRSENPGFLDRLSSGLGSVGGAISNGLDAITPSQGAIDNIAMRLQNAHAIGTGRAPLWMQQQEHQMQLGQQQELMQMRRAQAAHQMAQQQEMKRGHDLGLLEKALSHPKGSALLEQLANDPNFSLSHQAALLHKGFKEADFGSFEAYKEFIPEDVQQRFIAGKLPAHELNAWLDEARTATKENAKANAKQAILTRAINKPADQRTPHEALLVEEHQAALEVEKLKPQKVQSEIDENKAQAEKYRKEAEVGPKQNSVRDDLARAFYGVPFGELPSGGREQQDIMQRYGSMYAMGRQEVQQSAPATVKERSDVIDRATFLKTGAMNRPSAGVTNAQLSKGDYIQMSDMQQKQAADVDKAGANLKQLFGLVMPMIKAKTPGEAAIQYTKLHGGAFSGQNPDAATYKAGSEAFSSQLARVFGGEVGVMTNQDISRWQNTLPTFGDTKQVAERKQKLFFEIYDNAVQAFRNQIAGEKSSNTPKLENLLKQAENLNKSNGSSTTPSNDFIETRTTKDGRRLGKTKDGKIVEIK